MAFRPLHTHRFSLTMQPKAIASFAPFLWGMGLPQSTGALAVEKKGVEWGYAPPSGRSLDMGQQLGPQEEPGASLDASPPYRLQGPVGLIALHVRAPFAGVRV